VVAISAKYLQKSNCSASEVLKPDSVIRMRVEIPFVVDIANFIGANYLAILLFDIRLPGCEDRDLSHASVADGNLLSTAPAVVPSATIESPFLKQLTLHARKRRLSAPHSGFIELTALVVRCSTPYVMVDVVDDEITRARTA
jgi:hypothetical protein